MHLMVSACRGVLRWSCVRAAVVAWMGLAFMSTSLGQTPPPKMVFERGETVAVAQIGVNTQRSSIVRRIEYGVVYFAPTEGEPSPAQERPAKINVLQRPDGQAT